jgi:hypothetical protein
MLPNGSSQAGINPEHRPNPTVNFRIAVIRPQSRMALPELGTQFDRKSSRRNTLPDWICIAARSKRVLEHLKDTK